MPRIDNEQNSTMCFCPECGAATRMSYHLGIDCETIKQLRDQNIISVTTISGLHEQIGKLRAEVERFQNIFSPDVSIEMLEEGLQARAELHKLRAELEAAKESLDTIFDHIESTIAIMRIAEEASDRLAALKEGKSETTT